MSFLVGPLVLLVLILAVLSPLGLVWAINTLFGLGIAYTVKSWVAGLVLLVLLAPKGGSK
jgi:fumarate reductase subunit D